MGGAAYGLGGAGLVLAERLNHPAIESALEISDTQNRYEMPGAVVQAFAGPPMDFMSDMIGALTSDAILDEAATGLAKAFVPGTVLRTGRVVTGSEKADRRDPLTYILGLKRRQRKKTKRPPPMVKLLAP